MPLEKGVKQNLEFLIALRHEIEHRCTNRIDEAVSAKLHACCINFNAQQRSCSGRSSVWNGDFRSRSSS